MMNTFQHTPGPWFRAEQPTHPHNHAVIGIGNGAVHVGYASLTPALSPFETYANARLIAAAPRLLHASAALGYLHVEPCDTCEGQGLHPGAHQEACHTCGGCGEVVVGTMLPDDLRAIQAAVAQATGEPAQEGGR